MATKPMLFNSDMVRAIQRGDKTVTRRPVKPQHLRVLNSPYHRKHPEVPDKVLLEKLCEPPHQPGDIIYVREAWAVNNITPHDPKWVYKADYDCSIKPYSNWKWRPSIHMPKEAARIFLRVTNVRVEQLRDMTEEQAAREGLYSGWKQTDKSTPAHTACQAFMWVWNATIKPAELGKFGWVANPWVWVIEFERCEQPEVQCNGL